MRKSGTTGAYIGDKDRWRRQNIIIPPGGSFLVDHLAHALSQGFQRILAVVRCVLHDGKQRMLVCTPQTDIASPGTPNTLPIHPQAFVQALAAERALAT